MVIEPHVIFGLPYSASAEDISVAYSRILQEFPPEQYPRMSEKIRSLFHQMLNEGWKESKHCLTDTDGESRIELLAEVYAQMMSENWEEAVDTVASYLSIYPDDLKVRSMLGALFLSMQCFGEAVLVLTDVVRVCPKVAVFHQQLGVALLCAAAHIMRCEGAEDNGEGKALVDKARKAFETAVLLDPDEVGMYILVTGPMLLKNNMQKHCLGVRRF